jgi:hypothetical protein
MGLSLARRLACLGWLGVVSASACLPEDDIPAPGVAQFSFVGDPSQATIGPSADGWTLSVSRAVVGLQLSYQQLDQCDVYSQSGLEPILADALVSESAYLGRLRGLGECTSPIVLDSFVYVSRFGPGTTRADVDTINAVLDSSPLTRDTHTVSLYLAGTLRHADGVREKRVSWALDLPYALLACPPSGGGDPTLRYHLTSGKSESFTISVRLQRLFVDGHDDAATLRLAPFAEADQDGDGQITLEEVAATKLAPLAALTGGYQELLPGHAGSPRFGTLDPTLFDWLGARLPRSFSRAEAAGSCTLATDASFGGLDPDRTGGLGPVPAE